ncbi:MAG: hypothetical protein IKV57_06945 [Clostridia bacterium]|nr:hypothetical protein [Clostridia bacterium]
MDFTTPPAAREQFTEFLQCSLDVLRQIYVCVRIQRGMALLYEKIADGMDPAESMGLQKQMIPDVVEQDRKIKEILASPEGQYMLTYLPLRYCRMDTILWLRRRYRKCAFAGMESAFRASDGSISLFFCRMGETAQERKEHQCVRDILEMWLEDHPVPQGRP